MCLDESTSWTTLIAGTIVNTAILIYFLKHLKKDPNVIIPLISLLIWQYALLMQIPDALSWRSLNKGIKPNINIGKTAAVLNFTQPIIVLIGVYLIILSLNKPTRALYPAMVACLVYVILVLTYVTSNKRNFDVDPGTKCRSLDYAWWNNTGYLNLLYIIVTILCILAIPQVPGPNWRIVMMIIFLGSLFAMMAVNYKYQKQGKGDGCNTGSLWCWSIASAGLILFFIYYLTR